MKTMLFIFLFLAGSIVPNLTFAQFGQQGPKLVGTGAVGSSLQGASVAISLDSNTAIAGGPFDNNSAGEQFGYSPEAAVYGHNRVQSLLAPVRLEMSSKAGVLPFLQTGIHS